MKTTEQVLKDLVNKMLKKHGVDYDYVQSHPIIEDKDWFRYYTWTLEEELAFKEWAIPYLQKHLRLTKTGASKEIAWFLLMYGLTTVKE